MTPLLHKARPTKDIGAQHASTSERFNAMASLSSLLYTALLAILRSYQLRVLVITTYAFLPVPCASALTLYAVGVVQAE